MVESTRYLGQFIISAGKVAFDTSDSRHWRMRQPTPDEAADGSSAYRVMHRRILADKRLAELAGGDEAEIKREAHVRASAAEAVYMIPLLLEEQTQGGEWVRAFDPFDQAALAQFEALEPAAIAEMTTIYLGPIQEAIREAKKKSP